MKALIIGGGLIGVTSAYFLSRRGWEVTVLDRQDGPGQETSFANGSLLTPSMPEPWNAPGSWRVLLKSLGRSDSPLKLRLKALPHLTGWGVGFLRNSSPARFEGNTVRNLKLALHSVDVIGRLRQETGIEYGAATDGSLRVIRDPATLERALAWAEKLRAHGLTYRHLSADEIVAMEPALAPIGPRLAGGIHYPRDEIGNAYRYCVGLAEQARRGGVEFRFRTSVTGIEVRQGSVAAVLSGEERFTADRYVVAAGSYSPLLLKEAGLEVPVRPAKGYSLTFERPRLDPPLKLPICDDDFHAVVVPLENVIRVAGTAEFTGYDLALTESRIRNLVTLVRQVLPGSGLERAQARPWCGLRPMSVDGVPIIGATPIGNLWINTGHGPLGWTMAAGSGQLLSDLLTGASPAVDPTAYALARFTGPRMK
ncbi:MAG TPA: D-amino acid dehydrogenase [Steroidobacteraceae bacterium]|nr:D-amino acid dehydrogenase [Steroidobacteraceae bacterium]